MRADGDEPIDGVAVKSTVGGVFKREGEYWTLAYGGATCRLQDAAGMRHLAQLLARPNQKIAATALIQIARRRSEKRLADRTHPEAVADVTIVMQRARARVTRAMRAAMTRIARHHPPLAEHLEATIKTGTYCAYALDSRIAPAWTL